MAERVNYVKRVSFECNQCGKCCRARGDVVLYPMDIIRISKFLNISCNEFLDNYTQTYDWYGILSQIAIKSKKDKQLTCIFLNEENMKCKIYDARPIACSNFPFSQIGEKNYSVQIVPCVKSYNEGKEVIEFLNKSPQFLAEKEERKQIDEIVYLANKKIGHYYYLKNIIFKTLYYGYNSKKEISLQVRRRIKFLKLLLKF